MPLLAGRGARSHLMAATQWRLLATFDLATYLVSEFGIIAVTAAGVPPGPIYVTTDLESVAVPPETRIIVSSHEIALGHISLAAAHPWDGALPDPADLTARASDIRSAIEQLAGRSALAQRPFKERADVAVHHLGTGRPSEAARLLIGLGPGLTPAGDDALAAICLVDRMLRRAPQTVDRAKTTDISWEFIRWARAGQAIEPVHHLLMGDLTAVDRLGAYGGTSGADIAFGLFAALGRVESYGSSDSSSDHLAVVPATDGGCAS